MPGIERGNYDAPKKSAWNFEVYDSGQERKMMERLESDSSVRKWTKKHGIAISWIDSRHRQHSYRPDFLVEYWDGSLALIEVKAANRVDSNEVQRKRQAAERWCKARGMDYSIEHPAYLVVRDTAILRVLFAASILCWSAQEFRRFVWLLQRS